MDIKDTFATAWIPIRKNILRNRTEAAETAIFDLSQAIPTLVPLTDSSLSEVNVAIAEPPSAIKDYLMANGGLIHARQIEFLRVTARFALDLEAFSEQNPDTELDEGILSAFAAMQLGDVMEKLLMFSELSHPGRVHTVQGLVTTPEGGRAKISAKQSFFQLWHPQEGDPKWPLITTLTLPDVVAWIHGTSFFNQALAVSRIERSLAAFTHMVHLGPYREGEILFRAMQSLEAFYCDGIGDLRKQLAEKSALWVGCWEEPKNIVGHLYDMRSKFVHGGAKLSYWKDNLDPWEEDEKYMLSFEHAVTLATRLVVATLQRCIADKVYNIEWSYTFRAS
ncbi:hypothetical protein [Xanthomonas sacchari]|uniref:hypothetical protein n=1 Tax=Xanthomonas sacchari TaxID=56458 RepID=UPI00224DC501|nr:hypothetical protein [Xanthomonas sacchari]MCW0448310.1 hypothetical protein [Xanthomonas sacchari]